MSTASAAGKGRACVDTCMQVLCKSCVSAEGSKDDAVRINTVANEYLIWQSFLVLRMTCFDNPTHVGVQVIISVFLVKLFTHCHTDRSVLVANADILVLLWGVLTVVSSVEVWLCLLWDGSAFQSAVPIHQTRRSPSPPVVSVEQ